MAKRADMFGNLLGQKIQDSKLLVVGAGGIGCELLKTLVLTGFENIHVIDLDTIDLSNLNRQFLFHKQHIGKSKAIVAKESVLKFNPDAKIEAYHDSITNPKYNVEFYRQFTAVVNALDNIAARSHVNRMCMAAEIPLIESGSSGYLGHTTVHKRKVTECYECLPRKGQKTYPSCTIRNTPSEPAHCIVWSKHLFNQLFGETDSEDEVSPDVQSANTTPLDEGQDDIPEKQGISTREWAISTNYDPAMLFKKLFNEDILYLIRMSHLWEKRTAPIPLNFEDLPDAVPGSSQSEESNIENFRHWSLKECRDIFVKSLKGLLKRVTDGGPGTILVWDKDDEICLDFVASCSNLRAYCFHIPQKSKFNVKAIAGSIIPAIATTNAIVSGLMVLQILNVLKGDFTKCRSSWINEIYYSTSKLISSGQLEEPNPLCLVCSFAATEVVIKVNTGSLTLKTLEEKILKEKLHVVQPDVFINDGTGTILISSDPEERTDDMYNKPLDAFNLGTDSRLLCEDFFQNIKIHLVLVQDNELLNQEFIIVGHVEDIQPEEEKQDSIGEPMAGVKDNTDLDIVLDNEPEIDIVPVNEEGNGVEPPTKKIKIGTH